MPLWEVVNKIGSDKLKLGNYYGAEIMKYSEAVKSVFDIILNGCCINPLHINATGSGHEANIIANKRLAYVLYLAFYLGNYVFYNFETKEIVINNPCCEHTPRHSEYDLKSIFNTFKLSELLNKLGSSNPYLKEMRSLNGLLQSYEVPIIAYDNLNADEERKLQQNLCSF